VMAVGKYSWFEQEKFLTSDRWWKRRDYERAGDQRGNEGFEEVCKRSQQALSSHLTLFWMNIRNTRYFYLTEALLWVETKAEHSHVVSRSLLRLHSHINS